MFQELNLPKAPLKITKTGEQYFVFDVWRRKKLLITPEEWVRQHLLHYLVNEIKYPQNLISSEQGIEVNKLVRRCDAVVYGRDGRPKMIIECKAPEIKLSENTFMQIAQYNSKLQVDFLLVSNGVDHIIAKINREPAGIVYLEKFPSFEEICNTNSLQE